MIDLTQMLARFGVALVLGALMGLEREMVGKEAGIRTSMTVAGGAAIFAIIGLVLPALTAETGGVNMNVIANIVIGIGFLGAGIIIKTEERVHGLTTAAVIWATAAVGTLAGIGLLEFAAATAIAFAVLLYLLRKLSVAEKVRDAGY